MAEVMLKAQSRTETGKKAIRKMRREGMIPGIYYAHDQKSIPLLFDSVHLNQIVGSESGLIDLKIDNKRARKIIIKEMQFDPVSSKLLHIDVMGVKLKEKINIEVPIHLLGEPIGVKEEGGVLNHSLHEIEISCLPLDIPEHIEVDVSDLALGDSIHVSDLTIEKAEIVTEPDILVANVATVRAIVEEPVEAELELEEGEEPEEEAEGEEEETPEEE
ncbi:50S ribosomal protein L25 [candidate division KSB1 bacterium]|nr:50S ribosomal protein L25 [candidate division KSB1 bacterium]